MLVCDADRASRFARFYAERGWPVLPLWWPEASHLCACRRTDCTSRAKHPIHHLVPHGLRQATADLDTVASWWRGYPRANVGIRTGAESGVVVLDVDGEAGAEALRRLAGEGRRLEAVWVRTGADGRHAYLAHPGVDVPNSAGRIGPGLDIRGDGGYVVAPPSLHVSGRRYHWLRDPGVLPPMPGWLLELAKPAAREQAAQHPVRLPAERVPAYVAAAIEREAHEVAGAVPGQRNDRLNRAAFSLGQLVGAGLVDEATVTEVLVAAGLTAGPDERKIRSTVRRALRAGMSRSREVEPC